MIDHCYETIKVTSYLYSPDFFMCTNKAQNSVRRQNIIHQQLDSMKHRLKK